MKIITKILLKFKPLVWKIAELYDLQINKPFFPHGHNKIIIEDNETDRIHNIPKTTYFNTASGEIFIGKGTQFGERVQLLTGKHLHESEAIKLNVPAQSVPKVGRDIKIGRKCYIGTGAIIIGPIAIGDGAVIGAGAIVVNDVPPNVLVVSPPAIIKKKLINN